MENAWSSFSSGAGGRGHNGNCTTSLAWDLWGLNTSRFDWDSVSQASFNQENPTSTAASSAETLLMFSDYHQGQGMSNRYNRSTFSNYLYGGRGGVGSHYFHPDHHLVCLNLGKRHYFGDATPSLLGDHHVAGSKRGKPYYTTTTGAAATVGPLEAQAVTVASPAGAASVARCQVDGCGVALVNSKDYHRRHKVCEMHSKAPTVMVLGQEQRFCQQCSRFHAVSEFDDAKRSCRRRLAGHNERRRKSSHDPSGAKNPYHGRARSLLSSKNNLWTSSADLSFKSSAALRELIAENRAAILARQIILNRDWHWHHQAEDSNEDQNGTISPVPQQHSMFPGSHNWDRLNEAGTQVTLDLMDTPTSAFGFLSVRGNPKEEEVEQDCPELWNSFGVAQ